MLVTAVICFTVALAAVGVMLYFAFRGRICPRCGNRSVTETPLRPRVTLLACESCRTAWECEEGREGDPANWSRHDGPPLL